MAFQEVPDTASFKVVMRSNSQAVEINNTFYVRDFGTFGWGSVASLSAVATAIGDIWASDMMPLISSDAILDRVEARDESQEFGLTAVAEYNTTGGDVAAALSALMCVLVQITCDAGAAPRGGRLFISPFTEAKIARDTWDATMIDAVQVAVQDIHAAVEAVSAGLQNVRISRYSKTAVPLAPHKRTVAETNGISTYDTRSLVATQRDRRTGIGI